MKMTYLGGNFGQKITRANSKPKTF